MDTHDLLNFANGNSLIKNESSFEFSFGKKNKTQLYEYIGCPYFSSKLFTEANMLTFKQFISVSYKMCRMDIVENYALGFAYYKYKTLIYFYVVLCSFILVLVH